MTLQWWTQYFLQCFWSCVFFLLISELPFFFWAAPFILEHRVAVFAVARSEHTSEPGLTGSNPFYKDAPLLSAVLDLLCIAQESCEAESMSIFMTLLFPRPLSRTILKCDQKGLLNALNCQMPLHTHKKSGLRHHNHLFGVRYISFIIERKDSCFISKSTFWLWLKWHFSFLCSHKNGTVSSYSINFDLLVFGSFRLATVSLIPHTIFHSCPGTRGGKATRHIKSNPKTLCDLQGNAVVVLCWWGERMKCEESEAFMKWLVNEVRQDEKKTAHGITIDSNAMIRCHFNCRPQKNKTGLKTNFCFTTGESPPVVTI